VARSYNPADLGLADPKSEAWALAWVRRLAADVPTGSGAWPDHSLDDEEWLAWLRATAIKDEEGNLWFRPHEAAAQAIQANPLWLERVNVMGVYQQFRTADEAASAIRRSGAWIDRLIVEQGGPAPQASAAGAGIVPRW